MNEDQLFEASAAWFQKSLRTLFLEARRESTGVAYDACWAVEGARKQRVMVVLCVARPGEFMEVKPGGEACLAEDSWMDGHFFDALKEAFPRPSGDPYLRVIKGEPGKFRASFFIAADPCSVTRLEEMFNLPAQPGK